VTIIYLHLRVLLPTDPEEVDLDKVFFDEFLDIGPSKLMFLMAVAEVKSVNILKTS
jgi:hypothetical protein